MVYELCGASATFVQMSIIRSVSLQTVSPSPIAVSVLHYSGTSHKKAISVNSVVVAVLVCVCVWGGGGGEGGSDCTIMGTWSSSCDCGSVVEREC